MSNTQIDLSLYKIVPYHEDINYRFPSAIWGIRGLPGLVIGRDLWPSGFPGGFSDTHRNATWQIVAHVGSENPLAEKVLNKLQGQGFPTRREAVQAVEMALLLIEAEEGDKE